MSILPSRKRDGIMSNERKRKKIQKSLKVFLGFFYVYFLLKHAIHIKKESIKIFIFFNSK